MAEHVCTVCFLPMSAHEEYCDACSSEKETIIHVPPLCCPGCSCGSWEDAHNEPTEKNRRKLMSEKITAHCTACDWIGRVPSAEDECPYCQEYNLEEIEEYEWDDDDEN